jgi:hypothetical protein
VAVAVSDVEFSLDVTEAFDVANTVAKSDVALVVGLPVLHEIPNILDVHAGTWNLPQSGVTRSASTARLTLVASLLQELAA